MTGTDQDVGARSSVEPPGPSASGMVEKIRRNTACTTCRDSKVGKTLMVKCNASQAGYQGACSRCLKLGITCVVDKFHKRSTRRSKLEQLEKELNTIKDVVKTSMNSSSELNPQLHPAIPVPPPAPSSTASGFTRAPQLPPQSQTQSQPLGQQPFGQPLTLPFTAHMGRSGIPGVGSGLSEVSPVTGSAGSVETGTATETRTGILRTPTVAEKIPATLPRVLGGRIFSTSSINHYFDHYFQYFHPYFPILSHRAPDRIYSTSPLLFWTIIATATRRYPLDPTVFPHLTASLPLEIPPILSTHPLPHPTINALLLLCTWPLPTVRLLTDPSLTYSGLAMTAAMTVGIHTGKGCHGDFCFGCRRTETTDREAVFTWAGCNIVMQRVASINGCPANFALFNESVKGSPYLDEAPYFKALFLAQALSNRFTRTAFASLDATGCVPESLIALYESELDTSAPLWTSPAPPDLATFTTLCTRLDIQSYYFVRKPDGAPSGTLRGNMLRCYHTALSLVTLANKLERDTAFLRHAPYYIYRNLLDAACVILRVHLTPLSSSLPATAAPSALKTFAAALRAWSVQDNDLAIRTLKIMEGFWSLRHMMPSQQVISGFSNRIGSPVTFDSLRRWKVAIEGLKERGPERPERERGEIGRDGDGNGDGGTTGGEDEGFQDVDWDALMRDVDWGEMDGAEFMVP